MIFISILPKLDRKMLLTLFKQVYYHCDFFLQYATVKVIERIS